jgi:hypothetical protein
MTTTRLEAFKRYQRDAYLFSRDVVGLPLYPYQVGWAQHIIDVVRERRNETVIVEMARQSGKNQGQSLVSTMLLATHANHEQSSIVAIAPTYKPQLINSRMRFDSLAKHIEQRLPFLKFRSSMGYIYRCGKASIHFLSADPNASVVGATASLLMIVDEMQDVQPAVYQKNFSPMRASTNAPVAGFGTAWSEDTLLYQSKRAILEGRTRGKVYRVLPEEIAVSNPAYGDFVDNEIARLGRSHPLVKTQYYLEELATAGRMLNRQQLELMVGSHPRADRRQSEPIICAGLDFAGADEQAGELVSLNNASARDSVALVVAAVTWQRIGDGIMLPRIEVRARYEWTNVNPVSLHSLIYEILWHRWRVDLVYCDATGIGATGTAMLAAALNKPGRAERVKAVTFDSAWNTHTDAAFGLISAINNGNFKDYAPAGFDPIAVSGQEAPPQDDPHQHVWWQRGQARLEAKPSKRVRMYVPDDAGHDDLLIADGLLCLAAHNVGQPQTMAGASIDWHNPPKPGQALPDAYRSDAEIERMLADG